jgi:hypothetical protein
VDLAASATSSPISRDLLVPFDSSVPISRDSFSRDLSGAFDLSVPISRDALLRDLPAPFDSSVPFLSDLSVALGEGTSAGGIDSAASEEVHLSSESDLAPSRGLEDNPIYSETPSPDRGLGSTPRNCCLFVSKEQYTRSLVLINIHVCVNRMTHILYCPRVEGLPTPTPPHNPNRLKAMQTDCPTTVVPSLFAPSQRR